MTGTTTEVDETTFSKEDNVSAALHGKSVNLGLDVNALSSVGLEPSNIDLNVEVTDAKNRELLYKAQIQPNLLGDDGVLGHGLEVGASDDVSAASGGDKDVTTGSGLLHGGNLVTGHSGLEGVDRVDLGNDDSGTVRSEGLGTTLTNVTEAGNNSDLTGKHNVGGSLDTVNEGLSASIVVVELGLGDGVVNVDGGNLELAVLEHLVEMVNTGGGLLRETLDV